MLAARVPRTSAAMYGHALLRRTFASEATVAALPQHRYVDLPNLDQHSQLRTNITRALASVVPGWDSTAPANVTLQHLSGAMTNVIFTCEKPTPVNSKILLRVYGTGTD
ncbi:hypothetical protein ACHHYP_06842, partial [Achlya hypogyna]